MSPDSRIDPELLVAQRAWLHRLARQLISEAHGSADIAQDTLLAALESSTPERASLRTWLASVARKIAADRARAQRRRRRREAHRAAPEAEASTLDTVVRFELHRSVVEAVQSLREPMRTAPLLRFWEDLPPREIAKRTGAPVETVRTRIKRGLRELRAHLDAEYGRRDSWAVPLVSLVTSQPIHTLLPASTATAAGTTSFLASIGILMKNNVLLVSGLLLLLAASSSLAWEALSSNEDVPRVDRKLESLVDTGASKPSAQLTTELDDRGGGRRIVADAQRVLGPPSVAESGVYVRLVRRSGEAIADAEVGLLTPAEADQYREHIETREDANAHEVELARVRGALWQLSSQGALGKRDGLERLFGKIGAVRSDDEGRVRARRPNARGARVLAIWSPSLGLRFKAAPPPRDEPVSVECEQWPRLHGRVDVDTSGSGRNSEIRVTLDLEGKGLTRVLEFRFDGPSTFATPELPPAQHILVAYGRDYSTDSERVRLFANRKAALRLKAHAPFRTRLVSPNGATWDGHRIATRGWPVSELRFLLTREPARNHAELTRIAYEPRRLEYDSARATLSGFVPDAQYLELSVWAGREYVAGARLQSHELDSVALDLGKPKEKLRQVIGVHFDTALRDLPQVHVRMGVLGGFTGTMFHTLASERGARDRFDLELPGFVRGKTCRAIVQARGFATRILDLEMPRRGHAKLAWAGLVAAPHRIRGRVVDARGKGVARARLKIVDASGRVFRTAAETATRSDDSGEFSFEGLSAGRVRIFAAARKHASTSMLVHVDRTRSSVGIALDPGLERTLEVGALGSKGVMLRVLDAQGTALLDDRAFGAIHYGATIKLRVTSRARAVELYRPGELQPRRRIALAP